VKSVFGMCFNWKVLAGLGVVAAGLLVVAPGLLIGALPLLFLAACPLSMMLMMRGGHGHGASQDHGAAGPSASAVSRESLERQLAALHEEERMLQTELRKREPDAVARPETSALDVGAGNVAS